MYRALNMEPGKPCINSQYTVVPLYSDSSVTTDSQSYNQLVLHWVSVAVQRSPSVVCQSERRLSNAQMQWRIQDFC